jgi:type I restriction enzyme M protein
MEQARLSWITNFIWGIADDELRDLYVRGKYRDVILPIVVLRRLDAVLEPTKKQVLDMKASLDDAGVVNQEQALRQAAGQPFYNTSKFALRDLRGRTSQQQLRADFVAYLDGFSPNVQDILDNFEFRNQIPRLSKADALGNLIEKLLDPAINLSPEPVLNGDGSVKHYGLDNHAMGTIFEELLRRFNEENNEEAGEHWTPRDVVKLMTRLMFLPIANDITSGTYLLYDPACGTGGMLTVAEETLTQLAKEHGKEVATHLYGQEINAETYAIAKADLLMKGEGEAADNIVGGPEYSTLSNDAFRSREFDFMLSNPPYGKSWKTDLDRMGGKGGLTDPRFVVTHVGQSDYSLVTRSSDGQLMFMATLLSKMKRETKSGSRIAIIHNGSSLFTGDAGQGESNIRRWVIENDWLEAIVALPLNIFYNTGIATYVWVLTNRKPESRKGKVQLIDATRWFKLLRKNLGNKNCELSEGDIETICKTFLGFDESEHSKVFPNEAFGYWKVPIERPLRLHSKCTRKRAEELRFASGDHSLRTEIYDVFGEALFEDFPSVRAALERRLSGAAESGDGSDEESEGAELRPAPVPAAIRKRLLDEKKWRRDDRLHNLGYRLLSELGEEEFGDYNVFASLVDQKMADWGEKLTAADRKVLLRGLSVADEGAAPVIKKVHKAGVRPDPLHGLFEVAVDGAHRVVEYEPDTELRDNEQVPLAEVGGIDAFISREVLPHAPDAWYDPVSVKVGYEISFIRQFYKLQPLRTLEEIAGDILAIEKETEGLLGEIIGEGVR